MAEQPQPPKENGGNNPAVPPADPNNGGATPPKSEPGGPGDMIPRARLDEEINSRKDAEARLAKLESERTEAERKRLEEANQFKTLYEQEKQSREAESKKAREAIVRAAFVSKANGKNIVNLDDAYVLAQSKLKDVKIADDGSVTGIDEIIESLVKDKPYLVSKGSAPVGTPSNPAPAGGQAPGTRIYTHDEISKMSQADFDKNKDDINKAQTEGRIR